jgi:hypothetical protein
MVFYADHVQLCGVAICGGPRCKQARKALDLLRQKRSDGTFVAFGGKKLAEEIGLEGGQNSAAGLIRDLRDRISESLRRDASIECGRHDVILSGGPGYRLSDSIHISVQCGDDELSAQILEHDRASATDAGEPIKALDEPVNGPVNRDEPARDPVNAPIDPVFDGDDRVAARRARILHVLAKGGPLRAPAIAEALKCPEGTTNRDLRALKKAGRIRFVGAPKTGYYEVTGEPRAQAEIRKSPAATTTSASGPSAASR